MRRRGVAPVVVFRVLAASVFLGALSPAVHSPAAPRNDQYARGSKGAVVSAQPLATAIGLRVLRSGGNAVDAAVAVAFALAVVHPQAGNLGGGGFMVVRMADGKNIALDFRETAPRRAHRDMFLDPDGRVMPRASTATALAAGVPGSPGGLHRAWKLFGSKPWKELLAPAMRLAKEGFPVDSFLRRAIARSARSFALWPASAAVFLRDGKAPALGTVFRQEDLAGTLARIAAKGPAGFYEGETARLLADEMRRTEGLIDLEDLARYAPVERVPVQGTYRGHPILSMPPPSSGGVALLQMLNMLSDHDLRTLGHGSSSTLHLLIEVMKRAYADRARWLGDPDHWPVPVRGLIAEDYAKRISADIDFAKATRIVRAGQPAGAKESKDTTHFSVVDADGSAVSCTTTLNSSFGNKQVVPGAGFLLNNEMDDFSAKPGVPNQFGLVGAKANAIAAGKRMLSSMTPTIVLTKDGKRPLLVLGSPGGGRIINTVLQVLSNVIDHRLPLDLAVQAPRVHHQWLPKHVTWERLAVPHDVRAALEAKGHRFATRPGTIGRCQAIFIGKRGIEAVADPRSGGGAAAW